MRNKGGPPANNTNAMRHGLLAGKLPKGCSYIANRTLALRREVERSVISIKGEVTLLDASSIQSAIRWERHAMLCQRWLTKAIDELTPEQRLSFSREVARASTERDRCLRALNLDVGSDSVLRTLYGDGLVTRP